MASVSKSAAAKVGDDLVDVADAPAAEKSYGS